MSQSRLDATIRAMHLQRDKYNNHPIFQRQRVWTLTMKQSLIDTILRGMYIHPLLAHQRRTETGETCYDIIDGQQRLSTIFEFMEGKFATFSLKERSKKEEPAILPVIEPHKHYMQLSVEARSAFDDYILHLYILDDIDNPTVGLTFRRVQNQIPLTMAEKLRSYTSKTTGLAIKLSGHPLWSDWYAGKIERKQNFQGSLYIIMLELLQGYANMTTPRLRDLAAGLKDKDLTDEITQHIFDRLNVVMHAFAGTHFVVREEIIPMYQAILFLERDGYTFLQSDQGILSPWMAQVQSLIGEQPARHGFASPYSQLVYTNKQHDFWEEQTPLLKQSYQQEKTQRELAKNEQEHVG